MINILTNRFKNITELNDYCRMFNLVIDLELSVLNKNMILLSNYDDYDVSRPRTLTPPIEARECSHSLGGD